MRRVLLLGASETFGLYESEGHEFAEVLRQEFARAESPIEVINAAVAGMTVPSLTDSGITGSANFKRTGCSFTRLPSFTWTTPFLGRQHHPEQFNKPLAFRSRLLGRLMEAVKQFELVKAIRVKWLLRQQLKGKDPPLDLSSFSSRSSRGLHA